MITLQEMRDAICKEQKQIEVERDKHNETKTFLH